MKAIILWTGFVAHLSAWAGHDESREFIKGEVIVKYRDSFRARPQMYELYDHIGIHKVKRFSPGVAKLEHLIFSTDRDIYPIIEELRRNPMVAYAQPNYILHTMSVKNRPPPKKKEMQRAVPCLIPGIPFPPGCTDSFTEQPTDRAGGYLDSARSIHPEKLVFKPHLKEVPVDVSPLVKDPQLGKVYALKKIGATKAWSTFKGNKALIVANLDTGIDYNHEDLAFNLWRNPQPSEKNDVVGYDFIHNDGLPYDDHQHGTHTAGTLGAVGGNGLGISGVAQRLSIMSLKFLTSKGHGTTTNAVRAIDYAITHGAQILNCSWGGNERDAADEDDEAQESEEVRNQALQEAIERAAAKGALFITAAGNDGNDNDGPNPAYPASFKNDNIISVAATDENDELAYFSNFGKRTTHIAAPGANIYSTIPGNRYASASGTSMACPHVAGAAALLWGFYPSWDYRKVKDVLLKSVDHLSSLSEKTISGGRLNINSALNNSGEM
jgi:subtilisin family serine protease